MMTDNPSFREILQGFLNAYETYGGSSFCLLALYEPEKIEDPLFKERWGCLGSIFVHEHKYKEDIEELWIYGSLCENPLGKQRGFFTRIFRKQFMLQTKPYNRFKKLAGKAGALLTILPLHIKKKIFHDIMPHDTVEWWLSFLWYHNTPNKADYILPLGEYSTVNVLIHRTNWKHPFYDSITAIEEGGLLVNEYPQLEEGVATEDNKAVSNKQIASEDCLFRHSGKTWTIEYDGESGTFPSEKRFKYLYHIVKWRVDGNEGSIHVNELMAIVNKVQTVGDGDNGDNSGSQEITDGEALKNYLKRKNAIRDIPNWDSDPSLKAEHDELDKLLKDSTYLGKAKVIQGDVNKKRTTIKQAISSAIDVMKNDMPKTADHFDKWIKTGATLQYNPPKLPAWNL